jgi:hypothetical protein
VRSVSAAGQADVYNLSVATQHEYVANGLFVSNCDALRYGLCTEALPAPPPVQRAIFG